MIEPKNGLIIRYSYLWAREHDRNEEAGRKDRPACLQIILKKPDAGTAVALFPITSQPPRPAQDAIAIPEIEALRGGLRHPAWIIIDEFNIDDLVISFYIVGQQPLGQFSPSFMQIVKQAAAKCIRALNYRQVPRQ